MNHLEKYKILIRGAGELASAVGLTLYRSGFKVIMSELEFPRAIRRKVCFSDAIYNSQSQVEGVLAKVADINNYQKILSAKQIPIFSDSIELFNTINPNYYVDARMLKNVVNDRRSMEYFTVGLGPGFSVDHNCDAIIETKRGHNLGKVLWSGSAQKNTGIPGNIGGESSKRVIHSEIDGKLNWYVEFGTIVQKDQVIGNINNIEIRTKINGMVRGLISPRVHVKKGIKIADIDPRGEEVDYLTISDKARNIGRGVLEAIMVHLNK